MAVNGERLRTLRMDYGFSQEGLAERSGVNRRTIQRAEAGASVSLDTLNILADTLGVEPKQLRSNKLELFAPAITPTPTQPDQIVLLPATSGMSLIEMLDIADLPVIGYDIEPNEEVVEIIKEFAGIAERFIPDYDTPVYDQEQVRGPTPVESLELAVKMNGVLEKLAEHGIAVFAADYPALVHEYYWFDEVNAWCVHDKRIKAQQALLIVGPIVQGSYVRTPQDHINYNDIPF